MFCTISKKKSLKATILFVSYATVMRGRFTAIRYIRSHTRLSVKSETRTTKYLFSNGLMKNALRSPEFTVAAGKGISQREPTPTPEMPCNSVRKCVNMQAGLEELSPASAIKHCLRGVNNSEFFASVYFGMRSLRINGA